MADWYLEHDVGDLVVPKDHLYFDRLPSPDSWSHWGWPNNFDDAGKIVNPSDGSPHQSMSLGRDVEEINQLDAEYSYGSSTPLGSLEASVSWNSSGHGCPDVQLNNLAGTDPTADLFLSSLLHHDVPAAADSCDPLGQPLQSRCTMVPNHSDSAERMMDFHSIFSDTGGVGSSKYLITPHCSPSAGRSTEPNFTCGNSSDQSQDQSVKASETMYMLSSDQEAGGEDSSIEKSVLLELEAILKQLSGKTRLCFRDSLYRLAQCSQSQMAVEVSEEGLCLERPAQPETGDAQTRSTPTVSAESETNTIDRAVASLLFHMVDANVVDFSSMLAKFEHRPKASGVTQACNYGSTETDSISSSKPAKLSADFEVSLFSH